MTNGRAEIVERQEKGFCILQIENRWLNLRSGLNRLGLDFMLSLFCGLKGNVKKDIF